MGADPLVAIRKGMVFNQSITQSGSLLLERGIGIGITEGLKGSLKGRLQQALIPNTLQSSALG